MKACFALAAVIGLTSLTNTAIAAPAIAEGNGILHTTGSAGGRRIFVDGNTMGQTPQSVTVKCGTHTVRLGSNGRTESFDVPCGGEINVLAKLGEEGAAAPAASAAATGANAAATTGAPVAAASAAPATASPSPSPSTSASTSQTPAPTPLQTLPTKASTPLTFAPTSAGTPVGYKVVAGIGIAAAAVLYALRKRKGAAKKIRAKIDVLGRTSVGMRSELLVVDVEGTRLLVGMTPSAIQTLAVLETPEMGHGSVGELADEAPEKKLSREVGILDDEADPPLVIRRLATKSPAAASAKTAAPAERPSREIQALLANRRSSTRMPAVTPEMIAERREALAASKNEATERSSSESASAGRTPRRRRSVTGMSAVAGQARGLLLSMDEPDAEEADAQAAEAAPARKPIRLGEW